MTWEETGFQLQNDYKEEIKIRLVREREYESLRYWKSKSKLDLGKARSMRIDAPDELQNQWATANNPLLAFNLIPKTTQ